MSVQGDIYSPALNMAEGKILSRHITCWNVSGTEYSSTQMSYTIPVGDDDAMRNPAPLTQFTANGLTRVGVATAIRTHRQ